MLTARQAAKNKAKCRKLVWQKRGILFARKVQPNCSERQQSATKTNALAVRSQLGADSSEKKNSYDLIIYTAHK